MRSKTALGVLLALALLGAFASASASAAACTTKAGSKNYQLCVNGGAIEGTTTVGIESTKGGAMSLDLKSFIPETGIACQTTTLNATNSKFTVNSLTAPVGLKFKPYVHSCALTGPVSAECAMTKNEEFRERSATLSSPEKMVVAPGEGLGFVNFSIWPKVEGTRCGITGESRETFTFEGEYECSLQGAQVEAAEHEVKCASNAAHQVLARWSGTPVTPLSYSQTIALSGARKGQKFSIYEAA